MDGNTWFSQCVAILPVIFIYVKNLQNSIQMMDDEFQLPTIEICDDNSKQSRTWKSEAVSKIECASKDSLNLFHAQKWKDSSNMLHYSNHFYGNIWNIPYLFYCTKQSLWILNKTIKSKLCITIKSSLKNNNSHL